ncbi:MAG: phage integrase SAM-like domain-containing protein [Cytophagales bacterium]|nr:site-specific integrase [Bernardetiaceae bacterium]MDW8204657.1 phage integrase SAM-like domain-containing protein [Cytophagales bacterium]
MKKNPVHFYLHTPKKESSPIYLRFYFGNETLQCTTRWSIETKFWDKRRNFPKATIAEYQDYKAYLERIEQTIQDYYSKCIANGKKPTKDEIKQYLWDEIDGKHTPKSFFECFDDFLAFKGVQNTLGTVKEFRTLKQTLLDFEKLTGRKVSFESINKDFEDKFVAYLLRFRQSKYQTAGVTGRLLNSTISKRVGNLKLFMRWAMERGYHNNDAFKTFDASRRKDKPRGGGKNDIVVLTESEFAALKTYDFSGMPKLEKVRDLFLFATYTAQRWSDVSRFNPKDIKDNIWEFTAEKTKEVTRVPLVGWCAGALEVLSKYRGKLPKISSQKFNDYIKEACRVVGICAPVKIQRFSGRELITVEGEKWEFVSSHCARRTAITLLCTRGIPLNILQQLTGHDDIATLMKYVNTPENALADWLKQVSG